MINPQIISEKLNQLEIKDYRDNNFNTFNLDETKIAKYGIIITIGAKSDNRENFIQQIAIDNYTTNNLSKFAIRTYISNWSAWIYF